MVCDYRMNDTCNPGNSPLSCCERPEVVGTVTPSTATPTTVTPTPATPANGVVMVVSSMLLMAGMSIATLLL